MIEADDYRFTNRAWARYTGTQIIVAAIGCFGLFLTFAGWGAATSAISQMIVSTPDGVLIASRSADIGPGLIAGVFGAVIGIQMVSLAVQFWPDPTRYALPIEVEGYFTCGGDA